MSKLDRITLKETFNNASTGLYKTGQSRGIGSDDHRTMIEHVADSNFNLTTDAYTGYSPTATATGTDTYVATPDPALSVYVNDQKVYIKFTNANTGAATINLNGLGAKSIKKSGGTDLAAGDISANQILCLVYDGTNFQVVGGGGGGTSLTDPLVFKGAIDCSANPNYPAADAGDTYKVSVAGKIGGGSGPNVEVGDTLICTVDATAAGNHATVGTNWLILQTNLDPSLYALLASPTFTGTPAAPTAAAGTSTTQIATTEFTTNTVRRVNIRGGYAGVGFSDGF